MYRQGRIHLWHAFVGTEHMVLHYVPTLSMPDLPLVVKPVAQQKLACMILAPKRIGGMKCWAAGLGRKSVACIMLLCLGMPEFPVDVNVGRICSRLGWIPLDTEQALEVKLRKLLNTSVMLRCCMCLAVILGQSVQPRQLCY